MTAPGPRGGLALPVWIQYMAHALKDVPKLAPPEPPPGLVHSGVDWRYAELAESGMVTGVGLAPPEDAASEALQGGVPEGAASGASAEPADAPVVPWAPAGPAVPSRQLGPAATAAPAAYPASPVRAASGPR
jgi:penicillin-binding protein 1A